MVRCVKPTGIPDIDRGSKYEETIDDSLDSLDKGVRVWAIALDQEIGLREGLELHLIIIITILSPNKNL